MELVREKRILTEEQLARILDPAAMTGTGGGPESAAHDLGRPDCGAGLHRRGVPAWEESDWARWPRLA